jgi:stress-induced morphogen
MAISKAELHQILLQKFPDAIIKITDLAGDEDHYSLDISDKSFSGIPLIKQHRMVNDALAEVLHSKLHAITIKTGILT